MHEIYHTINFKVSRNHVWKLISDLHAIWTPKAMLKEGETVDEVVVQQRVARA